MFSHKLFQSCCSTASRKSLARPTLLTTPTASPWASACRARPKSTYQPERDTNQILGLSSRFPPPKKTYGLSGMPPFAEDVPQKQVGLEQQWKELSELALKRAEENPPAHAYSGRSVPVEKGKVAESIRQLDGILNRNRVRYYLRQTQRHEQRGEKLRRLKSERWRKKFASEVRNNVQLVTKIRTRGA